VPMGIALFGYWVPGIGTALWLGLDDPAARHRRVDSGLAGRPRRRWQPLLLWRWHRRATTGTSCRPEDLLARVVDAPLEPTHMRALALYEARVPSATSVSWNKGEYP